MRVALATNIVAPYRVPVLRRLAATPGWQLRVFTSAVTEFDRSWIVDTGDLDIELVPGISAVDRGATRHVPLGLPLALRRFRPDVVVSAELGARSWIAWASCALLRVPLVLWSYPPRVEREFVAGGGLALRRALLRRARAVIGMGTQAREVLIGWGADPEAIHDAPNAHDEDGLRKALAAVDAEAGRLGLRAALGCRERVALYAGRLLASKGVALLLDAWDELDPGLRDGWTLCFVGDGPLEGRVRHATRTHRPGEIVHVPAVPPDEVAAFYSASELLVLPSLREPWGLVVNEAMASGIPVCASRLVGCADDLVREGVTGWLFDPRVAPEFSSALARALACPDRAELGARAREHIARFGPESMATGMRGAILAVAKGFAGAPGSRRSGAS